MQVSSVQVDTRRTFGASGRSTPPKAGMPPSSTKNIHFVRPRPNPTNDLELALYEFQHQHARIISALQEGIWAFNDKGQTIYVSDQIALLLGYTPNEIQSKPLGIFVDEQSRKQAQEYLLEVRTGKTENLMVELFARGGRKIPVSIKFKRIQSEGGRLMGTIASVAARQERNSTDVPQSTARLYQSYFENSRDVIVLLTPTGIIQSLNPAFNALTGWELELWPGRSFDTMVDSTSIGQLNSMLELATTGNESGIVEVSVLTKAKKKIVCELSLTPQKDNGSVFGLVACLRDVTARKLVEEEFRQSQKVESLGRLSGGIAHDFNNILGIISAHASLFKLHKNNVEKLEQAFAMISKQAERATSLVRQLMTFARKTEVILEPVDLNKEVAEMAHLLQETFPRSIEIQVELHPELPAITADRTQLHQAILNLCVNARDAIREQVDSGTITLRTSIHSLASMRSKFGARATGESASFSVGDSGVGMTEEVKKKIFEPFFTTKPVGKGTGLGLAVVHGVVTGLGGFLDVESTPGKGTTFTAFVPLAVSVARTELPVESTIREEPKRTGTVLVVDDEESLLNATCFELSENGFTVLRAKDPMEAIKIFAIEQKSIDCVISDYGLPRQTGWDLLSSMKKSNPNVKTILTSGYLEQERLEQFEKAGIDGFVAKPYSPRQLFDTIDSVRKENA
jgi:PAS domain S-box-containing protein